MKLTVKLSTTCATKCAGLCAGNGFACGNAARQHRGPAGPHLGLPLQDIKIVMVNGRQHQVDDPMRDGDRIAYFPAVGGG